MRGNHPTRFYLLLLALLGGGTPALAQQTRPERTGNRETTRYVEVLEFLNRIDLASPRVHLASFGYSWEGRSLPLAVWGNVPDGSAESVAATGKTRVLVLANIHGGEVEGKEATLMLLRSLAGGEHTVWADSLVVLVAPIYNADGNERITLGNRPLQHGPVGGMGQRANAQGLDLNRDHVKLDSPEARSLVRLLASYDPHLVIDLHTTNGTHHAYQLTYAPPLHPNTDPGIARLLRTDLLPAVTRAIRQRHGWDFYHYGNLPGDESGSAERGWYTFDHRPRFNNNYVGIRNRFAVLSEAYAYLPFGERIEVTLRFVEQLLQYAYTHAGKLRRIAAEADRQSLTGVRLAVRARHQRSPAPATILMGEVARERHPFTGAPMLRRLDVRRPEQMPEFVAFEAAETERVPRAYLVPAELAETIQLLQSHGVRTRTLSGPVAIDAEEFRIDSTRVPDRPFQGHRERTLWGAYRPVRRTLPAGIVVVGTDQPLARLIFLLLEPRSDDGIASWNLLPESYLRVGSYPILRTMGTAP